MTNSAEHNIFDFNSFTAALQKAAQGVVRVKTTGGFTTGWLITDSLVVAPDFAQAPAAGLAETITCSFAGGNVSSAKVLAVQGKENNGVCLLRLNTPATGAALQLCLDEPVISSSVFLLQYAGGRPVLQISAGKLLEAEENIIRYNAATEPGSSGAPVMDGAGRVTGMHSKKYNFQSTKKAVAAGGEGNRDFSNEGPTIAAIMELLKPLPEWAEIAEQHHLAYSKPKDIATTKSIRPVKQPGSLLLNAALQWHFNPESLQHDEDMEALRPLVTEAKPEKWSMKLAERQRLIEAAGSLKALKKAYTPAGLADDRGEEVITRILKGPPYNLNKIDEADLPYWLQAVRWFGNTIPELPDATAVNLELEQRRMVSRLQQIAGPDFAGRKKELADMLSWYQATETGPLLVTGIGGAGKSALISKFLLGLPEGTISFWLDFDRADLSPDDAASVLTQFADQAYVQLEGFLKTEWTGTNWLENASAFAAKVQNLLSASGAPAPLLVLDGFEVAQYSKKYNEIWQVLEQLMQHLKNLKVIVSGRAPVKGLQLNQLKARDLPLQGMDDESATAWLQAHGITDKKIIAEVLKISGGIPLVLRLAALLVERGGAVNNLPSDLTRSMIEGYLYQRILDRVIDPLLQPLARDLLVVRKVNIPMLEAIFSNSMPPGLKGADVFERLMREMSLVNEADPAATIAITSGQGMLHLRPEVRSATLKLLEHENAERVAAIHEKAANWYKQQDLDDIQNRTELVYHYLQLGWLANAEAEWKDDCLRLLEGAELDFAPDHPAIAWLEAKEPVAGSMASDTAWEQDALGRIKDALYRDKYTIIPGILSEQPERIPGSSLLVFDALAMVKNGQLKEAAELLEAATPGDSAVNQQRMALQALIQHKMGNSKQADHLLSLMDGMFNQGEISQADAVPLLVRSARIRMQVHLEKELELYRFMNDEEDSETDMLKKIISRFLIPADIVLPAFCEQLDAVNIRQESFTAHLQVPDGISGLDEFRLLLNRKRKNNTGYKYELLPPSLVLTAAENEWMALLEERMQKLNGDGIISAVNQEAVVQLAVAGLKKWMLAAHDLYLSRAAAYLFRYQSSDSFVMLALANAFCAIRGEQLAFSGIQGEDITGTDSAVAMAVQVTKRVYSMKFPVTDAVLKQAISVLQTEQLTQDQDFVQQLLQHEASKEQAAPFFKTLPFEWLMGLKKPGTFSVLYGLTGPHPLDVLCRQLLGLPEEFQI